MFTGLSTTEVIIILLILIVVFGSKKIVELAKGAGEATRELKNIKKDFEETVKDVTYTGSSDTKPKKGGDDSHAE